MSHALTAAEVAEETQERRNVAAARWSIMHDGKLLPVTNVYDSDGNEITNHFHASACVAFDASLPDGKWLTIGNLDPTDLNRRNFDAAEVPAARRAGCH